MRIVINQDQDTVIASLKSVDGVKIARKPVFFYQGRKGMREYILRESWLKAVRIRTKQVRDVKTSVDFKLVRTNRLREVVFLLTFASVIFMMATVASGWKLWIPPLLHFYFLSVYTSFHTFFSNLLFLR